MVTTKIRLIIFLAAKDGEALSSAKTRPGTDCGSDHELLITKFRLKLKKVGKTTRPFKYDLNQILYDYIVKVRNRSKGLDLIDRVPDEVQTEVCDIVQERGIKTIPKKKKYKKAREFQKNIYFFFIVYTKAFDCVDHNKLWKILKEMGIPDHLTCLLRNLYAGQEATVRTGHGTTDWLQKGKEYVKAV